jgi:hypothetical protein
MNEKEKEWSKELDVLLGKLVDESLTAKEKLRLNTIMQDRTRGTRILPRLPRYSRSLGGEFRVFLISLP